MSQSFDIISDWENDGLAPHEIGKRVLEMLQRLEPVAPVMRNWHLLDRPAAQGVPLSEAEPKMAALVERNVTRDDSGTPDKSLGYGVIAFGWAVPETWDARTVHINVNAGSKWTNDIKFAFGGVPFPGDPPLSTDFSLVTHTVFKAVLKVFATVWPLPWALASTFDIDAPPVDAPSRRGGWRSSPFEVAWIAYLSAALVDGLSVPPEIAAEPTPGGGLLLSALDKPIDETNPDHMRRSRTLERIMLERVGVDGPDRSYRPAPHTARIGPY